MIKVFLVEDRDVGLTLGHFIWRLDCVASFLGFLGATALRLRNAGTPSLTLLPVAEFGGLLLLDELAVRCSHFCGLGTGRLLSSLLYFNQFGLVVLSLLLQQDLLQHLGIHILSTGGQRELNLVDILVELLGG